MVPNGPAPKVELTALDTVPAPWFEPPGRMELGRLNASPRMSIGRYPRSLKVLDIDMSISEKLGPYTASAPRFPRIPSPGTAKAALFRKGTQVPVGGHAVGVACVFVKTRFGRCWATPLARLSVESKMLSGAPD